MSKRKKPQEKGASLNSGANTVDRASMDSFPASDPPGWTGIVAAPSTGIKQKTHDKNVIH